MLATVARAADVPVSIGPLVLRGGPASTRSARIELRDDAFAVPLPDPRQGLTLTIAGGADRGQCHAEVRLDPAGWRAIGGDGPGRGFRYRPGRRVPGGIRRAILTPGRLLLRARGAGWPCNLAAAAERLPLRVVVTLGATRYCGAVDGAAVARNRRRRFTAGTTAAPAACPKTDVTVADLNILHGVSCDFATAACRLEERVALLFQWIAARGCPDVVTLQEVSERAAPLVLSRLALPCPFTYVAVYEPASRVDDQIILSRYPVVRTELQRLLRGFRSVLLARIDHPVGPLDVFTTHLASMGDGAQIPCTGESCPPECVAAGVANVRQCQTVQVAEFVSDRHAVATPAVVTGDFNEPAGSVAYQQLVGRGWLDTYLAAGNPECDPASGAGCTSGRQDRDLTQLESALSNEIERIDFAFLIPPGEGSLCAARLDPAIDADGDGAATRIFADAPNPFAPACGPLPATICWPSDHAGAELDLECGAAADQ